MERLQNEEDQKAADVDLIESLNLKLTFICTYVQLSYSDLEKFEDIMTRKRQEVENLLQLLLDDDGNNIGCKYVLTSLTGNMDDCISSHHHSKSDANMMDEQLVLLPRIWDLVKLRVITMSACSFFDVDADGSILIAEDTKLENLRCLHKLVLHYSKDTEHIFKRLPNLQLLQFDLKESWDYSTEQYWFPKLDCLTELEELEVGFVRSNTNDTNRPWDFHFPSSLKKLWLFDFPLTSDSLSKIARLPNLELLSLYRTIIHGEEWNMGEEDTVENLKCLKLHQVTLSKWEVGQESFPTLEKLKLEGCSDPEEIPPSFGDIYSLKIITLVESPQLEDSAMKIKEYAEDMRGGEELQVVGRNNIPLFK